ncbi:MAG: hypothetical protein JXR39_02990 [Marinilabiliaceae bacterium]|nr:hypothetical protein [Marinilabiliaceae bacterium]
MNIKLLSILAGCLITWSSCQQTQGGYEKATGPLGEFLNHSNHLTTVQHQLDQQNSLYTTAVGKNDEAAKEKILADIAQHHTAIIKEMEAKYPLGSIALPYEQTNADLVSIDKVVLAKYQFPWNTATRLSYIIRFECGVKHDKPLTMLRFEFIDKDKDIFMSSNMAVYQSGSYEFEIRPEVEFFHFEKILISVL